MNIRFSDTEIKKLLKNIVILVDKREQNNLHIIEYLKKHKRKYKMQSLKEGDYSAYIAYNDETKDILNSIGVYRDLYMTDEILIERKGSLDELAGNLCSRNPKYNNEGELVVTENRERERFKFELTRIRLCGARLFLFVEDKDGNENLRLGRYRSEYTPEAFLGSLKSFEMEFEFACKFLSREIMGSEIFFTILYAVRDVFKTGSIKKFITIEDAWVVIDE